MLDAVFISSLLVPTDQPMQNQCRRIVAAPCAARRDRATTGLQSSAATDVLPIAIAAAFSSAAVDFSSARALSGIAHLVRPEIGFVNVPASSRHPPPHPAHARGRALPAAAAFGSRGAVAPVDDHRHAG
jgi:hypothetical protein